ncbi:hypothetical protein BCR36DRAFT_365841 [Piromyces finnis]|uniref:Uncharacterized protein n=1 Tax=Piromyces finnis TaxID=1754191 RepID=A0A1Y1VPE2_9FUNG|nr:hypothetical protein BCR36DRAFT_365841 [Piromyces finnis]|eukprot:ORX61264.1 hypothetical protein BCR36DRAFT_365841 [Piromyces finnis]
MNLVSIVSIGGEYFSNIKDNNENKIFLSCNKNIIQKFVKKIRVEGICMINNNNPSYICRTTKEGPNFKVKFILTFEEKCTKDDECGDLADCLKNKICVHQNEPEESSNTFMKYIIVFYCCYLSIAIVLIVIYYVKQNDKKEKENNSYYFLIF